MLDDIPLLKPVTKPKPVTAHPTIIEALPFIESQISFLPFVNFLKEKRSTVSSTKEQLYNYLVRKFENNLRLLEPISDFGLIEEHSDLMELLSTSLFPIVDRQEQANFALSSPYQFRVFYYSDAFRKLFFDGEEQFLLLPDGIPTEELKNIQYGW